MSIIPFELERVELNVKQPSGNLRSCENLIVSNPASLLNLEQYMYGPGTGAITGSFRFLEHKLDISHCEVQHVDTIFQVSDAMTSLSGT